MQVPRFAREKGADLKMGRPPEQQVSTTDSPVIAERLNHTPGLNRRDTSQSQVSSINAQQIPLSDSVAF